MMGIYHKWKCVFVEIPKNASSAIHSVLRNNTDSINTHQTYLEYLNSNDIELVESYFSFAVCRNPYERFISAFEFCTKISNELQDQDFSNFLISLQKKGDVAHLGLPVHFLPQYKFVTIKNIILVDKIIKFEKLSEEWSLISKKINESKHQTYTSLSNSLDVINATPSKFNKNIDDFCDEKLKEIIYNLYKKDFEIFNYEK